VVSSGAAAAPVRHKVASPARIKHSPKQPEAPAQSPLDADIAETAGAQANAGVIQPTYDEIARLAYSYWEARGYQGGCPAEDWTRAEQALRNR